MMKKFLLSAACVALCGATLSQANAAGFYIQEQSVKGLGTAFAGSTTSIDDASTIYFNPAGMTELDGAQANLGVHLLIPNADITNNGTTNALPVAVGGNPGNPYDLSPIPNAFVAAPVNFIDQDLWVGIGMTAPFGLASDYGSTSFLRFDSTETELTTINVSPAIAYEVTPWLSMGAGVDVQYADATLDSALFVTSEGTSRLEGDDISVGYNIGFEIKPREDTDIGIHYRSAISHELDGRIITNGTGGDFNIAGTADLNLPDIATVGVGHELDDKTRVMGQVTWFGWEKFDEIRALNAAGATVSQVEQDYENTFAFAVGAEHDLNQDWTIRAGYQYDQTPTNDRFRTSRTPDGDRNWFSGGATYKFNEHLEFDMAATYIHISEESINVTRNGIAVNVAANTEGYVGIVAAGINWKF